LNKIINYLKKQKTWLKYVIINTSENHFYKFLERDLDGCSSVLDVGCGINSPMGKINKKFILEGIDLVDKSKKNKYHDKYTKGNILNIEKYFKNKSFDAVVLIGVIEHLKRSDGKKLITKLESIAKLKVIIETPNGFLNQEAVENNPYQEHISGWTPNDFQERGYTVYGLRGLKLLRGEYALVKYKPWYFWLLLSYVTQWGTYYLPKLSFELLAVKKINDS
jgi:hypothetical protein